MIKTTGKEKNYELIEYISDVNTQYTQVLMELNENGAMDAAYTYGTSRLTEDRFTGESNFYLYDPAGNVLGITDQDGCLWQSYRYDAFGNLLGEAAYRKFKVDCGKQEIDERFRTFEQWLDLYNTPTVKGKGRLVSIPEDRPRESGNGWGSPSWKSEEPLMYRPHTDELTYINYNAYDQTKHYNEISEPNDEFMGMARSEVYGIDRYWIAVGPRVMDEKYPYTGKDIQAEEIKYGTLIDVILRDSSYNTYFVPAIVGDIKEHTLDKEYGEKVIDENGKEKFKLEIDKDTKLTNGIYQTGYSWKTRELDDSYKGPNADLPNGAIVEFIRDINKPGIPDKMTRTTEFDILGLIVYDDSVSNYTIKSENNN